MTERLYYDDPYLREFEATVVEQFRHGDRFAVVLDRTAFYPTSGGQQHDRGWLNDQPVLEVVEQRDEILHLVPEPLPQEKVTGRLDWPRCFDFMQQHTAFHILAQSFLRELRVETLSSHLGETVDTIDVARERIGWEEVERVEELANRIVQENRAVRSFWVSREELFELHGLRKVPEISGKPIRLVEIRDFDLDPCGGTHVRSTGEVGMIKVLSWEKVRGNARLTFVAGMRALRVFQGRVRTVQQLGQVLSAAEDEMVEKVTALREQLKKREKELKQLRQERVEREAGRLAEQMPATGSPVAAWSLSGFSPQELKHLALTLVRKRSGAVVLSDESPERHVVIARSEDVPVNLRDLLPAAQRLLGARGGGSESFLQLVGTDPAAIPQFQAVLEKAVREASSH